LPRHSSEKLRLRVLPADRCFSESCHPENSACNDLAAA
jgi:hypothetical protein